MPAELEWAAGYLTQARVELAAAREPVDSSVRAMLLQMTFEKIAKAALLKNGQWSIARAQQNHHGATHMMGQLLQRRQLNKLDYNRNTLQNVINLSIRGLRRSTPSRYLAAIFQT